MTDAEIGEGALVLSHIRLVVLIPLVAATSTWLLDQATNPAAARLDQARAAMGGAVELAKVKTMVLKGLERSPNGWYGMGGKDTEQFLTNVIEIRILLPDGYFKQFTTPSGFERRMGFIGSEIMEGTPGPVEFLRENLGRLVFRVLLRTDSVYPFTLRGTSGDNLLLAEPDGTQVLLTLDSATSLPKQLKFSRRTQAAAPALAGTRKDITVEFADFRPVGKLRLPHKLVEREDVGTFFTETQFETIDINPPLTAASFKR